MEREINDLDLCLSKKEILPDIQAIAGESWFPKETTFEEGMNEYWGD